MELGNMNMGLVNKKKVTLTILIVLLVFGNIFFGMQYFFTLQQLVKTKSEIKAGQTNVKIVNFLNLFIQRVLKSNQEISFEDRLKLENAVRDINDPQVLAKWEQFTGGTNEAQVQQGVKELLEILVKKIY